MKLICIENNFAAYNKYAGFALNTTEAPAIHLLPDTSLLKDGRPFFVPDAAVPCTVGLQLAVRISRLGRSIGTRFAVRYYDAATVAATFTARARFDELRQRGFPWAEAKAFEGSVAIGAWQPVDGALPERLSLAAGEFGLIAGQTADMLRPADEIIARVSRLMTLRQGDILLLGSMGAEISAQPDTRVTGTMDGTEVLRFNIK